MEAVTRSSTSIVVNNYNGKPLSWTKALSKKCKINFFRSPSVGVRFSHHLTPLRHETVQRVASSKREVSMGFETADAGIQTTQPSKTVRVKFQLQEECLFGEHFLLVGDNPTMGSWDPSKAVPLSWSDGDLWTVELDIPVERSIKFKYVLRRSTGEVRWQPGPDRILRTWETPGTITITEDWQNVEARKITEETTYLRELVPNGHGDLMSSDDDIAHTEEKQTANRSEFFRQIRELFKNRGPQLTQRRTEQEALVTVKEINGNQVTEPKPSVVPEQTLHACEEGPV